MYAKKLIECGQKLVQAYYPFLVTGAPGVGKSEIILQIAFNLKYNIYLFHPVVSDPTDFKGLPAVVDGHAEFLPYGDLRRLLDAKKPTIAFLDDVGQAAPCVQAALMQLLLAREINGQKIPDCVTFVGATNRKEDGAGVKGILEPVLSRFKTVYNLDVSIDDWTDWAINNNVYPAVIGYANFKKDIFADMAPKGDMKNHACPRTMKNASDLLNIGLDDVESLSGAIGEGDGVALLSFIEIHKDLPKISSIVNTPKKAIVPTDLAALYAVVSALVHIVDKSNADALYEYSFRLPKEHSILLGRDIIRKDITLKETTGFIKWATKNQDVLL